MDTFMSETCAHWNNPAGTTLVEVETDIDCTPIDPMSRDWAQAYPIEKLYLARQTFTEYTAFVAGDVLIADTVSYAVKAVHKYDALGGISAYYHLILEQVSGS